MGIHIIKMPDIGEGIAEVELVGWHVNVGDTVSEDQALADVMTDKATVEIPSPVVGKVIALGGNVGDTMAVGSELIRLEVEGAGNLKGDAAGGTKASSSAAALDVEAGSSSAVSSTPTAPTMAATTSHASPESASSTAATSRAAPASSIAATSHT